MRLLIAQGIETFLEVGPGKVLCGLMRQIDRSKACSNVEDDASFQKAIHHLSTAKTGAAWTEGTRRRASRSVDQLGPSDHGWPP